MSLKISILCASLPPSPPPPIQVLRLSQYLLLQVASDDALIRLKRTSLANQQKEYMHLYFAEQHHDSIIDFVRHHIKNDDGSSDGLLMQVCVLVVIKTTV